MRLTGGEARGRIIRGPGSGGWLRPTSDRVREAIFDILGPRVPGSTFLDVCAGTGAVGIEALSRGAARVVFLERDRRALRLISGNLQVENWSGAHEVLAGPLDRSLDRLLGRSERFDCIFLDPPYETPAGDLPLGSIASLLPRDGRLIVEHRSGHPGMGEAPGFALIKSYRHGDTTLSLFAGRPARRDGPE